MTVDSLRSCVAIGLIALGSGCVWTSDGGVAARYESEWADVVESDTGSYAGEPIYVRGKGPLTIVGVPGLDSISVRARFYAGARDPQDAESAFEDLPGALAVERRDGAWFVTCGQASRTFGSVTPSSTGCAEMYVEVPAGSEQSPLSLHAKTTFGGIHASGLVVQDLMLRAPFGLVADVEPVDGATLALFGEDLVNGMCSSWLRVPDDTAFEEAALVSDGTDRGYSGNDPNDRQFWFQVQIEGFDDAPLLPDHTESYDWSREAPGAQVEHVNIRADLGKAILTSGHVPSADAFTLCASLELGQGSSTPE